MHGRMNTMASRPRAAVTCLLLLLAASPACCVTDASPATAPASGTGAALPGAAAAAAATAAALAKAAASTPAGTSGTSSSSATIGAAAAPAAAPAGAPAGSLTSSNSNAAGPGASATPSVVNAPTIIPPKGTINITIPGIPAASQPVAPTNLPPLAVCKFVVAGTAGALQLAPSDAFFAAVCRHVKASAAIVCCWMPGCVLHPQAIDTLLAATAATTSGAVSSATSSQAQGSANIMCIGAGAPVSLFSTGSGSAGFQVKTSGLVLVPALASVNLPPLSNTCWSWHAARAQHP